MTPRTTRDPARQVPLAWDMHPPNDHAPLRSGLDSLRRDDGAPLLREPDEINDWINPTELEKILARRACDDERLGRLAIPWRERAPTAAENRQAQAAAAAIAQAASRELCQRITDRLRRVQPYLAGYALAFVASRIAYPEHSRLLQILEPVSRDDP